MTYEAFLSRFDKVVPAGDGQSKVRCPAHDDRNPSLGVRRGDKGIVLRCHAGCDAESIARAMGLSLSDLFFDADSKPVARREAATYDYRDENRELLYQVVRFEPKDFRQRRPNGKGWEWNLQGVKRVPYRLPDLTGKAACVVVEGEKDAERLWSLNIPATCNVAGAGKWRPEYSSVLKTAGVQRVRIIPDNDEAGRAHANQVAHSCVAAGIGDIRIATLPDVPPKGDVSDYLTTHSKDDLLAALRAAPIFDPDANDAKAEQSAMTVPDMGPILVRLSDVAPEEISWLWPGWLARKKVAIIAGDPGLGKSFLSLDVAARVSTGAAWPDSTAPNPKGSVIFLAAEDGLADTVRPRLDAMGGDPSRVHVLQGVRKRGAADGTTDDRAFSLQTDLADLEQAIAQTGATLIVIDPVSNYLGDTDSYRDAEVRQVLTPLAQLAERTGVAVLLVMHLTKDTKASALHRLNSSIAFGGVARLVHGVGPDPEAPNPYADGATRIIANLKKNIRSEPPAVPWAFRTVSNRVEWLGAREDVRPDALFAGPARPGGADHHRSAAEAQVFLCRFLADGPKPSEEIYAAGKDEGFSRDQLYRARREVCDKPRKLGFGSGGPWVWKLKAECVTPPAFADDRSQALGPIDGAHPTSAIYGDIASISPLESMTPSKIAVGAIYGGHANNGGDEWGEV